MQNFTPQQPIKLIKVSKKSNSNNLHQIQRKEILEIQLQFNQFLSQLPCFLQKGIKCEFNCKKLNIFMKKANKKNDSIFISFQLT